jgi:hypothetical protein
MGCVQIGKAIVCGSLAPYKAGDMPPEGYIEWQDWAEVQTNAGLKQSQCGHCGKFRFPQEMSSRFIETIARKTKYGQKVRIKQRICKVCDHENAT